MFARKVCALLAIALITATTACDNAQFSENTGASLTGPNENATGTPGADPKPEGKGEGKKGDGIQSKEIDESKGLEAIPGGVCGKNKGAEFHHISGNQNKIELAEAGVYHVKVTGNQNEVGLTLASAESIEADSLCLFIAGNQNKVSVKVSGSVGSMTVVMRGNLANVDIEVLEGASLKSIAADSKGNAGKINVHGAGTLPAATPAPAPEAEPATAP